MNFGLLLSQLPQVQESRIHYDAMLSLQPRKHGRFAVFMQRLKALFS
ncbi:hypothetical protein BGLT_03198 [Caballeronia glathei]|jgi:hypothetical protein|nr:MULTISPECIES: hypothetical protein [Burkholderiaceae]TCK34485.1 hypothetical protein B0G84_6438 [Paraburkholderia sp. BL8N3]CDY73821.1 hypothetical protein BGLT_03198 [Caballeronia glathei]